MTSNRINRSLQNLRLAVASLEEFLAEPIRTNRDKAGIIQAFEFTYELAWKTFQKIAQDEGLQAGLILPEDEAVWIGMMQDRNLTSHTYHESLATAIVDRIRQPYFPLMKATIARVEDQLPSPSGDEAC
jgi:nucleotidyltransferase substrate binding protein (TIGR01987 family)